MKKGTRGTVRFIIKIKPIKDVCISTNCGKPRGTPRVMPGKKNKHDPRFMGYKPIKHRSL